MNNNSTNNSEALARLQAAAQYAARPAQPLEGARRSQRVQPYLSTTRKGVQIISRMEVS